MASNDPNRPVYTGLGPVELDRLFKRGGEDIGNGIAQIVRENPAKASLMNWNEQDMRRLGMHVTLSVLYQLAASTVMTAQQADEKYPKSVDELTELLG